MQRMTYFIYAPEKHLMLAAERTDARRGLYMRRMEFKMERPGLLQKEQCVTVTEGLLPSNYYYTIDPSLAMSGNIPFRYRLKSREGIVTEIVENARGFYVTVEFDEPEVEMK